MFVKDIITKFFKNRILSNIFWLFFDKGYGAILTLFIYSLIARHFGKEVFGIWNYMLAFGTIIPAFAGLGLNFVIVKKLKENPNLKSLIISNALLMRLFLGFFIAIVFFFIYYLLGVNVESEYLGVVILIFLSQIILNTNVFIYKNEADLNNKNTVIARNVALTIGFALRYYGINAEYELSFFAFINIIEYGVFFIISLINYRIDNENIVLLKLNYKVSLYLSKQGFPLMLASITVILYLKIDQLIIAYLLDNESVGIYSPASRITEMFYALPVIISNVFFPKIIELKEKNKSILEILRKMYALVIVSTIFTAFSISFFSESIIDFVFGIEYKESIEILILYSWSLVFMGLLVSSSKYLIAINRSDIILKREIMGMVSNVALNFILIPLYGISGAAVATLISYSIASFFSNLFFKELRPVMKEQFLSIYFYIKLLIWKLI